MTVRWLVVLVTAAALVTVPVAIAARPVADTDIGAPDLARRIQASADLGWSGLVESSGTVQLPDSDTFANLAQLLGERNRLRVWWRSGDDWRIDTIRTTGETDLVRNGSTVTRWVFESQRATIAPASTVRLPDASDLVPATLAHSLLEGSMVAELSRLPARRIAGIAAPGLRLVPSDPSSSIGQVDVWADPRTGLPLAVEVYGLSGHRPVLTTLLREVRQTTPSPADTRFTPARGSTIAYESSVDVAAQANAFAAYTMPGSLAGLASRPGTGPSRAPVGVYGRGATTMSAVPLRADVARPLRQRLRTSPDAEETGDGVLVSVGPIGVILTTGRRGPIGRGSGFLITGTVNGDTLQRAATQLLSTS